MQLARVDSRKNESTLCIFNNEVLVRPSALMIASISSRKGAMFSGLVAREYNAWEKV
jgi:hypothetical protein